MTAPDRERRNVWVRVGDGWSYLSDLTEVSWDIHRVLTEEYQPYRPLDEAATAVILAHLKVRAS